LKRPAHRRRAFPARQFFHISASIVLGLHAANGAAQSWPAKPIRIIAAQSAGGVTDMLARTLAQKFNEAWKLPVIVENRPGAGGAIGTEVAAKSAPDGYTLLLSSAGPIVINPGLYPKLGYDPLKDLVPISYLVSSPLMLVTHPSVPARTVRELIALAKAQPDKLSYGSGGSGSPPHLTAELFKSTAGIAMTHIPFKGSAPSVLALVAGQVDLSFSTVVISLPQVRTNRLRALAMTSPARARAVPDLPTMIEAGVPGFESQQWFGLFAPAGLPKDIQNKLYAESARIMNLPEIRERIANDGGEPGALSQEQFAAFIRADAARWSQVVRISGATAE
jgi:tripartite-type tricarboxylate transporter receptor subunit TctC